MDSSSCWEMTQFWKRRFLFAYALIKKGGLNNVRNAVRLMEVAVDDLQGLRAELGNRSICGYLYLGLAYKQRGILTASPVDRIKAKRALLQAANMIPLKARAQWELASILTPGREYYLCRKYMYKAWRCCKEMACIANGFRTMRKKLKCDIMNIKCGCCGNHSYLISKESSDKLKVCAGCHVVYYCDTRCQKLHWNNVHREQCSRIWIKWNQGLLERVDSCTTTPLTNLRSKYPDIFKFCSI